MSISTMKLVTLLSVGLFHEVVKMRYREGASPALAQMH